LRIAHDDLRAVRPDIICLSITGFGEGGPMGDGVAGFDPVLQAMSGMMRAQGGDSDPVFSTVPVNDVAASATVAFGACVALFHRARSGQGQRGWTSLAGMSALLQSEALMRYADRPPPPVGGRDYRGVEGDGFVESASGWVRVRETADGVATLPARTLAELAADEELIAYGVLHPDPRPDREGWLTPGRHARLSRTELAGTLVSPALGQHTREVLREAGLEDTHIDRLVADGVAIET
jgi:crotonobetainyl-CoA:carnitine CoA-transferase CaiB-like acyl-CoA transferase